jgi:hypothetical protein
LNQNKRRKKPRGRKMYKIRQPLKEAEEWHNNGMLLVNLCCGNQCIILLEALQLFMAVHFQNIGVL